MRLDVMIKQIDEYVEKRQGYGTMDDDGLAQVSKWLKELKKLRKQVKHCYAHGCAYPETLDELAKRGVLT